MGGLILEEGRHARNLVMSERLTISDAAKLKDLLVEAYQNSKLVLIDTAKVEFIDLACMQVLCSAHQAFHKAGKSIELVQPVSAGFEESLANMAIDCACCAADLRGDCLWKKGA